MQKSLTTNKLVKLLAILPISFLSGCVGPQASFKERMHDNFAFTSTENVQDKKCITLTQPFTLKSGAVTYSLPAGEYISQKKNDAGYFYYAPSSVTSSNWLIAPPQDGVYLNNQLNKGNVFGRNPYGFDDIPIRGAILPNSIFTYIKKSNQC